MNPDPNNDEIFTPADVARRLFSEMPSAPNTKCILPQSDLYVNLNEDNDETSFNFELLLTIYMEGFMNIMEMMKPTDSDSSKKDYEMENDIYKNVTIDDLKFPDPWFRSFGYTIVVQEYQYIPKQLDMIKPLSYCRILLSFDPNDRIHFIMNNISTKYHFILNNTYVKTNILSKIFTLLIKEDKFYKISFNKI